MKQQVMEQGTPEWLDFRKSRVGSSDAPIVMKQSPWKTPYQLWQEKLGLVESDSPNYAMERGTAMEPIARAALEEELGMPLKPITKLSIERSWMMASLDAFNEESGVVGEIKCPGNDDHEIAMSGQVPEKYYAQLQHQLVVCGVECMYYFSFIGTRNALLKVYRDDKYISKLLEEEEKFFECMSSFEAPELISRDYVCRTDAKWSKLAERLLVIKELQKEEEEIKKELIKLAEGKNSMGGGVKLSKCLRKGAVDYKKIPQLEGMDLEPFRKKSSEFWRIS